MDTVGSSSWLRGKSDFKLFDVRSLDRHVYDHDKVTDSARLIGCYWVDSGN